MKTPKSIKVRILKNMMLFLAFAWALTIGIGYVLTQKTLNQQLDLQLEQIADSLSEVATTSETTVEIHRNETIGNGTNTQSVQFQIWRDERMINYSEHAPKESLSQDEGYSQNEVANKRWRVFSARNGNSRVVVGQDLDVRRALVQGMILSNLWPMLIALPIIALILWLSVTAGLKPLSNLAAAITKRSPEQLTPIDLGEVPTEVAPVVRSLNNLLGVVDQALEREKHFTDNAAHELRTPLAAIKTQAQVALRSENENERLESITAVNQGVDRAARMVSQLLTLARLDPANLVLSFAPVDLGELITEAVAVYVPRALEKHIDIGISENSHASISGEPTYLEMLFSNLLDNAVRYTPANGRIDIRLRQTEKSAILEIEDDGAGIRPEDRARVFDRFVRLGGSASEGSGIGLAIVKKIVAIHHGVIELDSPLAHSGLIVRLTFHTPAKN